MIHFYYLPSPELVSMALYADLFVNRDDGAPCYNLPDGSGFRAISGPADFRFICRDHPLVVDADAYWFGDWQNHSTSRWMQTDSASYSGSDSAMSISWHNRTIDGQETIYLSTAIRGGSVWSPPVLDLSGFHIPEPMTIYTRVDVNGKVTESNAEMVSLFIVVDGESRNSLEYSVTVGSPFTFSFFVSEFGIDEPGTHRLDIYAVESAGDSSPPFRYTMDIVSAPPPSRSRTLTAAKTRTRSSSGDRPQTPAPTSNSKITPTPTPIPLLLMNSSSSLSLVLAGVIPNGSNKTVSTVLTSFNVRFWIPGSYLTISQAGSTTSLVTARLYVTTIGPLAIVAVSLLNGNSASQAINVSMDADLYVNGNDRVPCYDIPTRRGFYAPYLGAWLNFSCNGHPLGVDVSTYWFGTYSMRSSNLWNQIGVSEFSGDSGMALSWQNRVIPAGGKIVLSTVIRWGLENSAPVVSLLSSNLVDVVDANAQIDLRLRVTDSDGDICSLYVLVDNNFTDLFQIAANIDSGSELDVSLNLSRWQFADGSHSMRIYAIDPVGTVSRQPVLLALIIARPTPRRTQSPTSTRSLLQTRSPIGTRTMIRTPLRTNAPVMRLSSSGIYASENFVLRASPSLESEVMLAMLVSAFETVVEFGNVSATMVNLEPEKSEVFRIVCRPIITLAGPVAIVAFRASSFSDIEQRVNISLHAQLAYTQVSDSGGIGFYVTSGTNRMNFYARQDQFFANADAYYFGPGQADYLWSQGDAESYYGLPQMSISWHKRLVPPRGEVVMSTVVSWGIPQDPPIVTAVLVIRGAGIASIFGTIVSTESTSVSILIAIDEDYSRFEEAGTFDPGATFRHEFQLHGTTVTVYAIDSTGAISKVVPTLGPTDMFTPALPPTASFTTRLGTPRNRWSHRRFVECGMFLVMLHTMS
jgi:hypothetical protein